MSLRLALRSAAWVAVLTAPVSVAAQARSEELSRYFATQVDREDIVRIPMRDGKRLNASLFFPKGRARQALPTILTFYPYQISAVSPENRAFLENYLAAPTYKAMAMTADGKSHATQYGAQSMEIARKAVLEYCQEQFKVTEPCKIVMENDTWVGPQAIGSVERKVERPLER